MLPDKRPSLSKKYIDRNKREMSEKFTDWKRLTKHQLTSKCATLLDLESNKQTVRTQKTTTKKLHQAGISKHSIAFW